MKRYLTIPEWEEHLLNSEMEAIDDYFYQDHENKYSSSEVLEAIVNWNGGISSANHIKSIISRVYGVELDEN